MASQLDRIEELLTTLNRRLEFLDWCDCLKRYGACYSTQQEDGSYRCDRCNRIVKDTTHAS